MSGKGRGKRSAPPGSSADNPIDVDNPENEKARSKKPRKELVPIGLDEFGDTIYVEVSDEFSDEDIYEDLKNKDNEELQKLREEKSRLQDLKEKSDKTEERISNELISVEDIDSFKQTYFQLFEMLMGEEIVAERQKQTFFDEYIQLGEVLGCTKKPVVSGPIKESYPFKVIIEAITNKISPGATSSAEKATSSAEKASSSVIEESFLTEDEISTTDEIKRLKNDILSLKQDIANSKSKIDADKGMLDFILSIPPENTINLSDVISMLFLKDDTESLNGWQRVGLNLEQLVEKFKGVYPLWAQKLGVHGPPYLLKDVLEAARKEMSADGANALKTSDDMFHALKATDSKLPADGSIAVSNMFPALKL